MSPLLASALIAHIVLGLIGLAALHFAYMQIIRTHPPYRLIVPAAWAGVVAFFASWATGAYYYVVHYGGAVKPRILDGGYPFAHQFFMEAKEHVFIFIPFLAIVFALITLSLKHTDDAELRRVGIFIASLILVIGVFAAASGILISGAVR